VKRDLKLTCGLTVPRVTHLSYTLINKPAGQTVTTFASSRQRSLVARILTLLAVCCIDGLLQLLQSVRVAFCETLRKRGAGHMGGASTFFVRVEDC
jgi:hypothetical protein